MNPFPKIIIIKGINKSATNIKIQNPIIVISSFKIPYHRQYRHFPFQTKVRLLFISRYYPCPIIY